MYIAICDDQADELGLLIDLLYRWQEEQRVSIPFKSYRNAAELLAEAPNERLSLIHI